MSRKTHLGYNRLSFPACGGWQRFGHSGFTVSHAEFATLPTNERCKRCDKLFQETPVRSGPIADAVSASINGVESAPWIEAPDAQWRRFIGVERLWYAFDRDDSATRDASVIADAIANRMPQPYHNECLAMTAAAVYPTRIRRHDDDCESRMHAFEG